MMMRAPPRGARPAAVVVAIDLAVVASATALSNEDWVNVRAIRLDYISGLGLGLRQALQPLGDAQRRRAFGRLDRRAAQRDEEGVVPALQIGFAQHPHRGLPALHPLGMRHIERL